MDLSRPMQVCDWWVAVSYDGEDQHVDLIGCTTYRHALDVIDEVAPLIRYLGPVGGEPKEHVVDGVANVDLYDFEGRLVWSTVDGFRGAGLLLERERWSTGRYAFRPGMDWRDDALVPVGVPAEALMQRATREVARA